VVDKPAEAEDHGHHHGHASLEQPPGTEHRHLVLAADNLARAIRAESITLALR
jgi:hypothetical protein